MFTLTVAGALSLCAVSSSRQLPTGPGYAFSGDDARGAPPPPKAPLSFAASLDDYAVLQSKTGGDAYVYGTTASTAAVTVKVSGAGCPSLIVEAELSALPTAPGRLSVTTRAPPPPPTGNAWKAKVPGAPGGDCTIVASDGKNSVTLNHVTYGDVWYCGGQSNMALPVSNTFSRFKSEAAIRTGKYSNIRIKQMAGNMNPELKWQNVSTAVATNIVAGGWGGQNTSALQHFSSTCYYFGESLTDELGSGPAKAPAIGLIHTAWGGSMIEQWLSQATVNSCVRSCSNATSCGVSEWWNTRVLPFAGMTVKGWVWYQGENNMHGFFGNSQQKSGYACLAIKLVEDWRQIWSKNSGTSALAPFGVVTLPPSGGEGGADIGSMRYAQTGSYGIMPNPAMPNTFVAQGYDMDDPTGSLGCYHSGCCGNLTKDKDDPACAGCVGICNGWSAGIPINREPSCGSAADCPGPRKCPQPSTGAPTYMPDGCAPVYMGPIHDRNKKPIATVYGKPGPFTGPTITGCTKAGNTITITFNASLMVGDALEIQPYNASVAGASQMAVLVNATNFCFQQGKDKPGALASTGHPAPVQPCWFDGFNKVGSAAGVTDEKADWVQVDIKPGSAPHSVDVDLTKAGGKAFGIRYGWLGGGSCCSKMVGTAPNALQCAAEQCPLMLKGARLPANPFMAKITAAGKCECMPPQKCDV